MDRCRNPSTSLYKCITGEGIYRHDRSIAKKTSELNRFARQLYGWFLTGLPAGSGMRDDKEGN